MPQNNSQNKIYSNNFNNPSANILVIRFSALGDVILTKSVLKNFIEKYPNTRISMLSQELFRPIFQDITDLIFLGAELKKQHKGLKGLWKLAQELRKYNFNIIIDLHNVLRSVLLTFLIRFPTRRIPVFRINKGRRQKYNLTRRYRKVLKPLKHTTERYAEVFTQAGFPLTIVPISDSGKPDKSKNKKFTGLKIGIAPLSRHELKEWPMKYMTRLMQFIADDFQSKFYLLGGANEARKLEECSIPGTINIAGKYSFAEEIEFLKTLDLIITMDSANMHLAGMLDIPCISIWGPTHPFAGFSPLSDKNLIIQNHSLNCRPCSVFGNKPCYRKDHACMIELFPEDVYKEIKAFILKSMVK